MLDIWHNWSVRTSKNLRKQRDQQPIFCLSDRRQFQQTLLLDQLFFLKVSIWKDPSEVLHWPISKDLSLPPLLSLFLTYFFEAWIEIPHLCCRNSFWLGPFLFLFAKEQKQFEDNIFYLWHYLECLLPITKIYRLLFQSIKYHFHFLKFEFQDLLKLR